MGVAVMFPGQGSQSPAMGATWRDTRGWAVVERAEAVLGEPVSDLLLDEDPARLSHTREAQLAVFLTSLAAWEATKDTVGDVVAFAGHSLGQLTALTAAGVLDLDDALRLVARRAEVTQAAADKAGGGMIALLGAKADQAEAACGAAPDACWLANDNAPGQLVLAGTDAGLESASEAARTAGVRKVVRLEVNGPFHTPLMQPAVDAFAQDTAAVPLANGSAPVVSNEDAQPATDAEGWRQRLLDHLVHPVRWRQSLETLVAMGPSALIEVGPGRVLAGLAKKTVPDVPVTHPEVVAV